MKNIIFSIVFSMLFFNLFANNSDSLNLINKNNHVTNIENIKFDTERIKIYLLNGIWIEKNNNKVLTYQFFNSGLVHVSITKANGDVQYEYYNWNVDENNDGFLLTLSKNTGMDRMLIVSPNGKGFSAFDIVNHNDLQFQYSPYKDDNTLGSNIKWE